MAKIVRATFNRPDAATQARRIFLDAGFSKSQIELMSQGAESYPNERRTLEFEGASALIDQSLFDAIFRNGATGEERKQSDSRPHGDSVLLIHAEDSEQTLLAEDIALSVGALQVRRQ